MDDERCAACEREVSDEATCPGCGRPPLFVRKRELGGDAVPRQLRPLWATVAASVLLLIGVNIVRATPDTAIVLLFAVAVFLGGPLALQRAAHSWWVTTPTLSAGQRVKRKKSLAKNLMTIGSVAFMISIAAINARALRSFPAVVLGLLGGGLLSFGAGAAIQIADQKPRRRR